MLKKILLLLSLILIAYGLMILSILGFAGFFNYFWLASGLALGILTLIYEKLNKALRKIITVIIAIGLTVFIMVEIRIFSFSLNTPQPDADYIIVLGSQIRSSGPSIDFKGRLDKAIEYLSANPQTRVITTGGQGTNEPIPEGEGGAEYLIQQGIDAGRIIIEDESLSTVENLLNTRKILQAEGENTEECSIVIVSNSYHLLRASLIAQKLGFNNISCSAGHGLKILDPHYFAREFFALIKEWLTGNI